MELDDLDLPSKITEKIALGLSGIGVDVPLGLVQVVMLVLCLVAFLYGINKLRKDDGRNLVSMLVVTAFGLYTVAIGYSWINIFVNPLPGELEGSIEFAEVSGSDEENLSLLDMHMELHGLTGESAGLTFGAVDSRTGRYIVSYTPSYFDYPRKLVFVMPGCAPKEIVLKRDDLLPVAESSLPAPVLSPISFNCGEVG